MTLHKFTCKECDGKPFYTDFEPIYDEGPAFCPCCGKDKLVTYVGMTVMNDLTHRMATSSKDLIA